MKNISLCMHTWCEVRNFASQKFRLTPALPIVLAEILNFKLYAELDNVWGNKMCPVK